eukprot:TRINITY_DN12044_c0_g1_i1.p1 TRINITY_DN12044_c0_g1~~TRINITY_DN12044_c0_g1_i1.p1  ORF type:complete len:187 (-),score=45.71 TRINITY_DN12044_c0_g1_i1:121-681(-)
MASPMSHPNLIVWVDCEMTGLDLEKDVLMEVAVVLTDKELNKVDDGKNFIIHQPDSVLDAMVGFPKESHASTGLTEACRNSKLSLQAAEAEICSYIHMGLAGTQGKPLLAGNSIGYDAKYLRKYMPAVTDILHYRVIDVSSIKECCKFWKGSLLLKLPKKQRTHRALDDIYESIDEMKYYREHLFK